MISIQALCGRAGTPSWLVLFRDPPGQDGRQTSRTFTVEAEARRFAALLNELGPTEALAELDGTGPG